MRKRPLASGIPHHWLIGIVLVALTDVALAGEPPPRAFVPLVADGRPLSAIVVPDAAAQAAR
jgi:hypothetical protein